MSQTEVTQDTEESVSLSLSTAVDSITAAVDALHNGTTLLVEQARQLQHHQSLLATPGGLGHVKLGAGFEVLPDGTANINGTADFAAAMTALEAAMHAADTALDESLRAALAEGDGALDLRVTTAQSIGESAQATASAAKAVTDAVSVTPSPNAIPRAGADGKLPGGWLGNGGGMIPVGHIAMLPFRYNQLPAGWYFCNGTRYNTTTTAVGAALKALPATLKSDWGMSLSGSGASETINVPNWFYGGRGPVMRAVDGSSRYPGSVEDGAIQNITGTVQTVAGTKSALYTISGSYLGATSGGGWPSADLALDTSRVVATANEVRMLNRGMTPAIFLGV